MNPRCPECGSVSWKIGKNKFGTQCYKCPKCDKRFNQRYGTPFHGRRFADGIVIAGLLMYAKYPLSGNNVAEILNLFGINVTGWSIWNWTQDFAPYIKKMKKKYKIKFSKVWHVDEKFIPHKRVPSEKYKRGLRKFAYQITVYDSEGNVIASYLAPERNSKGIEKALKRAREAAGERPELVVSDGLNAYDTPVRRILGRKKRRKHVIAHFEGKWIIHNKKLMILSNNKMERYHSEISPKVSSMRGIKNLENGDRFFQVYNFMHNFFIKDRIKGILKTMNLDFNLNGLVQFFYTV